MKARQLIETCLIERGGQKANHSQEMRDAFATAQAMAHAGKNNTEIQAVTGWFVDKYDKRLRFEVSDSEARLRPPSSKSHFRYACDAQATVDRLNKEEIYDGVPREEAVQALKAYFAKFGEHLNRDQNKALSDALRQRDMALLPEPQDIGHDAASPRSTLYAVLDHPKLYAAYPEIASVTIETAENSPDAQWRGFLKHGRGSEPATIGVVVGRGAEALKHTLMHEIQHWIQDFEGFASGASTEGMASLGRELYTAAARKDGDAMHNVDTAMAKALVAKLSGADKAKLRAAMSEYAVLYATDEELLVDGIRSLENIQPLEFEGITADEQAKMKQTRARARARSERLSSVSSKVYYPTSAYYKAAGEIEARDVADRAVLNQRSLKDCAPYSFENIAPEDAIIMFGRGPKEWAKSILSQ